MKNIFWNYKNALKFLYSWVKKYKFSYFMLILVTIIISLTNVFLPILTKYQTDQLVEKSNNFFGFQNSPIIIFALITFLIFLVETFSRFFSIAERYITQIYFKKVNNFLRQSIMKKLASMPLWYYVSKRFQKTMPSMRNVWGLQDIQNFVLENVINQTITLIWTVAILSSISWKLTAIVLASSFLNFLISRIIEKQNMKNQLIQQMNIGYRNNDIEYYMTHSFDKVVTNWAYNDLMDSYEDINQKSIDFEKKQFFQTETYSQLSNFIRQVWDFVIKIFLWYSIINGWASIWTFAMSLMYLGNISSIFDRLFWSKRSFENMVDNLSKLEIFLRTTDSRNQNANKKIFDIKNIKIQNLSFAYPWMSEYEKSMYDIILNRLKKYGEKDPSQWIKDEIHILSEALEQKNYVILKNINLEFERWKSYAIVGYNWAWKTTLTNIIKWYFDNYEGKILLNWENEKIFDRLSLLENFWIINQEPFIMRGFSIRENMTFGVREKICDEKLWDMLKIFELENIVKKFREWLDTKIGYNMDLSWGQNQLICLIRLILQNRQVLIIDEWTNQLDARNEDKVLKMLLEKFDDKIIIFISHRMSSIRKCDQIICMEQGKITDIWTHVSLMKTQNLYHEFVDLQMWKDE